ncbi:hypothetical protein N8Z37_01300 [Octadecabacter sp.]|nr:hypothetical protein [Octadecabacter sp.]
MIGIIIESNCEFHLDFTKIARRNRDVINAFPELNRLVAAKPAYKGSPHFRTIDAKMHKIKILNGLIIALKLTIVFIFVNNQTPTRYFKYDIFCKERQTTAKPNKGDSMKISSLTLYLCVYAIRNNISKRRAYDSAFGIINRERNRSIKETIVIIKC